MDHCKNSPWEQTSKDGGNKNQNEKSSQSKWNENPQGRLVLGSVVTDKHGDYQIEQLRIRMSWGFIQLLLRIIIFWQITFQHSCRMFEI